MQEKETKGKDSVLVVIETIYGGGSAAVALIEQLRVKATMRDHRVTEYASPNLARAILAGSDSLAIGRKLERFSRANYLFDLSARAAVCAGILEERPGTVILCKNFTAADVVNARMLGLEWRGKIEAIEQFARTVRNEDGSETVVVPDLNIFLDVPVEIARKRISEALEPLILNLDRSTADNLRKYFGQIDLRRQRELFLEEFIAMGNSLIAPAGMSMPELCSLVIRRIEELI